MRFFLLICSVFLLSACSQVTLENTEVVDTHIHFFDTSREEGVMWPPKSNKILYKPSFPKHFQETATENNIKAAVVVQASNWVSDADWNLKVTEEQGEFYPAIVCNLSTMGTEQFRKDLDRLRKNPRLVGVRITHPPEGRKFFTPQLMEDLHYMAEVNTSLDILHRRFEFSQLLQIAKEIPNLKIMIGIKGLSVEQRSALAKCPNVYAKLANNYVNREESLKFLEETWGQFGEDRIVFGSNWPATQLKRNAYPDKKAFLFNFLKSKSDEAVHKVFSKNAMKFYKISK